MIKIGKIDILKRMGGLASLSAAMLLFVCSCTKELGVIALPDTDDARVILSIRTPKSVTSSFATRSTEAAGETAVGDIRILVFQDPRGSGDYTFAYMVRGSRIAQQSGGSSRFEAILRTSSIPLKLIVLANSGSLFDSYSPVAGQDEASVRSSLEIAFPQDGMPAFLPMYGEVSLPLLDAGVTNLINVTVLRAVARVDVVTRLDADSRSFDIREVRVYRANDRLRVIPDGDAATVSVTSPTLPESAAPLGGPLIKSATSAADSIGGLYLPESQSVTGSEQRRLAATTIVVGGVFEGDDAVTYYRVDFNSGVDGHPFGQVLRNYLYSFSVKRVTASGWPTPEEAATNIAASMTVDVRPWEGFTSDVYFHGNYIGVSTRRVQVPFLPNYTRTVDVESTMNYSIEWVGTPSAGKVSDYGVPLSDGYFTATITHDGDEAESLTRIRIESPQYNDTDSEITATLRLSVNDTSVDIVVVKESPVRYSGRAFQVMSMGTGYGSLGDYATTVPTTLAMRKVLDVNFSPTSGYPFKIGGFFFLTVAPLANQYTASTTPENIAYFKKMIDNVDILVLPYANNTSPQVADMLLDEWLVENPNRVLWVMLDDTPSNAGIRARFQQEGLGTWQSMSGLFDSDYGYRASRDSDYAYSGSRDVGQFFTGPFGTVTKGSPLFYADVISSMVRLTDSGKRRITPLVYNNNPPYDDYMSVGVETGRGVVYQGESQLFQGGVGMSGTTGNTAQGNGTIVTEPQTSGTTGRYYLDLLNANLWAWAVGRVLYGPPPED